VPGNTKDFLQEIAAADPRLFDEWVRSSDHRAVGTIADAFFLCLMPPAIRANNLDDATDNGVVAVSRRRKLHNLSTLEMFEVASLMVLPLKKRPAKSPAGPDGRIWIGRGLGCDIVLPFEAVSRAHAVLERVDGAFVLCDTGSSNGTYVEDEPLAPGTRRALPDGACIFFGSVEVKFIRAEMLERELSRWSHP
jgi:hypothetical protein